MESFYTMVYKGLTYTKEYTTWIQYKGKTLKQKRLQYDVVIGSAVQSSSF
jgi:hypothetical protein